MFYSSAGLEKRGKRYRGYLTYKGEDGEWHKRTKLLAAMGKTEAKRELSSWHMDMEKQAAEQPAAPKSLPIADKLVPAFVNEYIDSLEARNAIEPSSVLSYRNSAKFISAAFARTKVKDLNPEHILRWEERLSKRGLSSSTIGKAHRLLKQVMKYAVDVRAITYNPVSPVKPPKRVNKKPGINSLDLEARTTLLDALASMGLTPITVASRIALYTGLREAEVCGLQWRDIDMGGHVIWIRRSIGIGDGGAYVKLSKTDKTRDVALPQGLIDLLEQWHDAQKKLKHNSGLRLTKSMFILSGEDTFFHPATLSRGWATLASAIGVHGSEGRIPTFHDLRHTWATMYLAAGGDVKTAASNLGHANAAMTLNIYASADPDAKRRAALLIDSCITR